MSDTASRETCRHGHPRPQGGGRCQTCQSITERHRWNRRHAGHHVDTWPDGRRRCRTCDARYQQDQAAVERALAGDPPPALTQRERRTVVLTLVDRGLSGPEIAWRAGCTVRTVRRIRRRAREAGQEVSSGMA